VTLTRFAAAEFGQAPQGLTVLCECLRGGDIKRTLTSAEEVLDDAKFRSVQVILDQLPLRHAVAPLLPSPVIRLQIKKCP
jgi:hypothetical protein